MCGRFAAKKSAEAAAKYYAAHIGTAKGFQGSYNLCPTEQAPIVIEDEKQDRVIDMAAFGIPTTIKGKTFPLLNYQSETAGNREDFRVRRCVVPADGFYEWEQLGPKDKQPYYFSPMRQFLV